jgi:hypothetical protein
VGAAEELGLNEVTVAGIKIVHNAHCMAVKSVVNDKKITAAAIANRG